MGGTCGGIRVSSLYAPNGRTPTSPTTPTSSPGTPRGGSRSATSSRPCLRWWPTATSTWRRPMTTWGSGRVHRLDPRHAAERQALADLRSLGLRDVLVPMANEAELLRHLLTPWDDRAGMFREEQRHADRPGVRDEGRGRPGAGGAYVDREARKGKGPSYDAPVVGGHQRRMRAALSCSTNPRSTTLGRWLPGPRAAERHCSGAEEGGVAAPQETGRIAVNVARATPRLGCRTRGPP